MASVSRGKRLARRYPILNSVPEDERPAIVRAALKHPLVILLVVGGGLLGLPLYLNEMFGLLGVEQEPIMLLKMVKFAGIILLPVVAAVPILSRFILPPIIRREMRKRGYVKNSKGGQ